MTPDRRKKIKALLNDPASTDNEKEICRKLLKDNPEPEPVRRQPFPYSFGYPVSTPRSQESGDFWRDYINKAAEQFRHHGTGTAQERASDRADAFRYATQQGAAYYKDIIKERQAAARQQQAAGLGQAQDRQDAARQQAAQQQAAGQTSGLFGQGLGGGLGGLGGGLFGGIGQQASNRFMNELLRIMAEDGKKKK